MAIKVKTARMTCEGCAFNHDKDDIKCHLPDDHERCVDDNGDQFIFKDKRMSKLDGEMSK